MKTAISLPDPIFQQAERLARRLGKTRSELYREAVAEYLTRHSPESITRRIDEMCAAIDTALDANLERTQLDVLRQSEW